jgi:hypothetical protein
MDYKTVTYNLANMLTSKSTQLTKLVSYQYLFCLIFTRKHKCEPIQPLRLDGKEIAFTGTVKYLGVSLDPD